MQASVCIPAPDPEKLGSGLFSIIHFPLLLNISMQLSGEK